MPSSSLWSKNPYEGITKGATIVDNYRYNLWRRWASGPFMVYCMLNPSTADALVDDPTIARCTERAKRMGYGGIWVVNIFAYRATDPKELYKVEDPIGPENDFWLKDTGRFGELFVCGWGKHGKHLDRAKQVYEMLVANGQKPHCLKTNKDGSPAHPLYIGYDVQLKPWENSHGK